MLAPTAAGPIAADPADTRRGDADLAIDVTAALNGLPDVLRQLVVLVRFGRHSIPNAGRALGL